MEGKKGEGTAGGGAHPRTFVAVFLPEDEADDPYEVLLPADDTYDARARELCKAEAVLAHWPYQNAKKRNGFLLMPEDARSPGHTRRVNHRATLLCHHKKTDANGERVLMQLSGPAVFCDVEIVDHDDITGDPVEPHFVYRDTTLQTYQLFFSEAQLRYDESKMGAKGVLSTLLRSNAMNNAHKQYSAAGSDAPVSQLPLLYKPGEWRFSKPPKSLLMEYKQKHFSSDVHFNLISASPFLYSVYVPDLAKQFQPKREYASRSKKEAEHQVSLLVLQYMQGTELCGTVRAIDQRVAEPDSPDGAGNDGESDSTWVDVHGDGGILKKIIQEGEGVVVAAGDYVSVHYVGRVEGERVPYDSTRERDVPFTFRIVPADAEDPSCELIEGLHDGIATMKLHEKALLRIAPMYAYRMGLPNLVPAGATVIFEVELLSIGKDAPSRAQTNLDLISQAEIAKAEGNIAFANRHYRVSTKLYNEGLSYLKQIKCPAAEEIGDLNRLLIQLHCNAAQSYINLSQNKKAAHHATQALEQIAEEDCDNGCERKIQAYKVKAYCRRGQALLAEHKLEEAKEDFQQMMNHSRGDPALERSAQVQMQKLACAKRQHNESMATVYAKMFTPKVVP